MPSSLKVCNASDKPCRLLTPPEQLLLDFLEEETARTNHICEQCKLFADESPDAKIASVTIEWELSPYEFLNVEWESLGNGGYRRRPQIFRDYEAGVL